MIIDFHTHAFTDAIADRAIASLSAASGGMEPRTNGTAGGLIGAAGSATIEKCYSTCSVSGGTAGGFVGSAGGSSSIADCYCTGLVSGDNAFVRGWWDVTVTDEQLRKARRDSTLWELL